MEGVSHTGDYGNQLPPIRRRPRAPSQPHAQGNPNALRRTNQALPDPHPTLPRNPPVPRQPRPGQPSPMNAIEVHAHQDNGYGYGHVSGYGNTYNNHQGHVQPHQNANSNGQYPYAEENHYVDDNTGAYGQGYDSASQQGKAHYESAYDGAHGVVCSGEANGEWDGYGVQGMNGRGSEQQQAVGQEQHEPNEKCMQCVHGIGVPIAKITTRAVFKGTRCIACVCTIL